MSFLIRTARREDLAAILAFVKALAAAEDMPQAVEMDSAMLDEALFGSPPSAHAFVAESDGQLQGLGLYFFNFSSWTGKRGLYVEDLFVHPDARGTGLGKALLARLAAEARAQDCPRMEWSVLEGNDNARGFYERLGAVHKQEWHTFRLEGQALDALAGPASR